MSEAQIQVPASAYPQIILGEPLLGFSGDNTRIAYGKFNVHRHDLASSGNFLIAGAKPSYFITGLTYEADEVFPSDTFIETVSPLAITTSRFAVANSSDVTLYMRKSLEDFNGVVKIPNCTTTKGSKVITCKAQDGFITAEQLLTLSRSAFSGVINALPSGFYPIAFSQGFGGVIESFAISCLEANSSAEVSLYIAGSGVKTLQANNSIKSFDFTQNLEQVTSFTSEQTISLSISNISSSNGLASIAYRIRYIKSLDIHEAA